MTLIVSSFDIGRRGMSVEGMCQAKCRIEERLQAVFHKTSCWAPPLRQQQLFSDSSRWTSLKLRDFNIISGADVTRHIAQNWPF